jgi:PKHD-type hydroxylase
MKKTDAEMVGGFISYTINNALSNNFCESLIDTVNGSFSEHSLNGGPNVNLRKGNTTFGNQSWVYDAIWPYLAEANEAAGWKLDITGAEDYQIAVYKSGDFYGRHIDSLGIHAARWHAPNNDVLHNKARKISLSVALNDPSEYEGGELDIWQRGAVSQNIGTMNFFPSYITHEVKPVTKGTRYSLVLWFLGPPLR